MATSGALMIGVKSVPPMPPTLEIVTLPPARLFRERRERACRIVNAQLIGIWNDRHDQPIGRIRRESDVEIFLEHQILAALVEGGIELREFLPCPDAGFDDENQG